MIQNTLLADKIIFLTGASGVIGQALLQQLADTRIICLTHHRNVLGQNVHGLNGDITLPHLGLSGDVYDEILTQLDCIIHSAALTDFSRPEREIRAVNVDGTRRILALASQAGVPFYYISTAFVYPLRHRQGDYKLNAYEVAKRDAEQLVRESGVPHVILRPSLIVGDSATGEIHSFQGFHRIIELFMKGFLPIGPASPNSFVDFIPQDYFARILVAMLAHGVTAGEYWVTAGVEAMSIQEILDTCVEVAPQMIGRTLDRPRLVTSDTFERLIRPVFLPALPPKARTLIESVIPLFKYFNIETPFPSSRAMLEETLPMPLFPNLKQVLVRNIAYWAAHTNHREGTMAHLLAQGA